jgi:hypothetical protein
VRSRQLFRQAAVRTATGLPEAHEGWGDELVRRGLIDEGLKQFHLALLKLEALDGIRDTAQYAAFLQLKCGLACAQVGLYQAAISEIEAGLARCPSADAASTVSFRRTEATLRSLHGCCLYLERRHLEALGALAPFFERRDLEVAAREVTAAARSLYWSVDRVLEKSEPLVDLPKIGELMATVAPRLRQTNSWRGFTELRRDLLDLGQSDELVRQVQTVAEEVVAQLTERIEEIERQLPDDISAPDMYLPESASSEAPEVDELLHGHRELLSQGRDLHSAAADLSAGLAKVTRVLGALSIAQLKESRAFFELVVKKGYRTPLRSRFRWLLLRMLRLLAWLAVPIFIVGTVVPWILGRYFDSLIASFLAALLPAIILGLPAASWFDRKMVPLYRRAVFREVTSLTSWLLAVFNGSNQVLNLLHSPSHSPDTLEPRGTMGSEPGDDHRRHELPSRAGLAGGQARQAGSSSTSTRPKATGRRTSRVLP